MKPSTTSITFSSTLESEVFHSLDGSAFLCPEGDEEQADNIARAFIATLDRYGENPDESKAGLCLEVAETLFASNQDEAGAAMLRQGAIYGSSAAMERLAWRCFVSGDDGVILGNSRWHSICEHAWYLRGAHYGNLKAMTEVGRWLRSVDGLQNLALEYLSIPAMAGSEEAYRLFKEMSWEGLTLSKDFKPEVFPDPLTGEPRKRVPISGETFRAARELVEFYDPEISMTTSHWDVFIEKLGDSQLEHFKTELEAYAETVDGILRLQHKDAEGARKRFQSAIAKGFMIGYEADNLEKAIELDDQETANFAARYILSSVVSCLSDIGYRSTFFPKRRYLLSLPD